MAQIGLDMVYVSRRGTDNKVITDAETGLSETGVYAVDTNKANGNLGSKTANVTGLSGTPVKIPGNNEIADISNPPSAPTVAWDANMINIFVKEKLLGRVSDGKGGYIDGDATAECGMLIETHSPITGKKIYFGFGRGTFNETAANIQTNTDTAETREDDNLTFTALTCPEFNGKMFKKFYEDDPKFDKKAMLDSVFPGQTFVKEAASNA